jgi:DNA gyrase subunit B
MSDTANLPGQWAYDASQIKVLEWLEPVRHRPWMYIGSTDTRWLHHMVYEIIDNAVDEALAWYCHHITVTMSEDSMITVEDDWRGIPVDIHAKTWKSALETILTVLHAWWKFEKWAYKISWWLHGVGSSVVNALSKRMRATIHKNGKIYTQSYKRGLPQWDVEVVGETAINGSTISFQPDDTIFETTEFSYYTIATRLKHAAYLTPGVVFTLVDETKNKAERFYFEWGIKTWLTNLVGTQNPLTPQFALMKEGNDVLAEIVFQFVDSSNDNIMSFVNNITTKDGGTHVVGFKNALLTVVNDLAKEKQVLDKKIWQFQISDITDGLYAIVSVKIPEPQFEGQTKWRLGNSYVKWEIERMMAEYLRDEFKRDEDLFWKVFEKIHLAARARMAAKLARETVMRKNAILGGVLPGKLADCSIKKSAGTELYIVEGNSAWWSAKQARDSKFQAILPLRGKVLNTEQSSIQKILANAEIKSLVLAIGAGMKDSYDEPSLRYDKIVIMTDADVDGAHIRTLLLTFFFRYMRSLIEQDHLYIAVPPLYKLKQGKQETYIYPPDDDLDVVVPKYGYDLGKVQIQRYKGLGEMNPEQLWETTMDPATRKMFKVNVEDAQEADRLFRVLMGDDVSSRKHFILTHAKMAKDIDV